jgi:membrane carboxypeptidase/penicillin-binding protein
MVTLEGTGGLSSVTGGSFPAQMWTSYMQGALEGQPVEEFAFPTSWVDGGVTSSTLSPSPTATASQSQEPTLAPSETVTGEATQTPEPVETTEVPEQPSEVPITPAAVEPTTRAEPEPSGVAATGSPAPTGSP